MSIPDVIACTCDHMTSYGGSVLLLPDQIDFTDLTVSLISSLHSQLIYMLFSSPVTSFYIVNINIHYDNDEAKFRNLLRAKRKTIHSCKKVS